MAIAKESVQGGGVGTKPAQPLNALQHRYRRIALRKIAEGRYQLEESAACICGSEYARRVAVADRFGLPVGVLLCLGCGLLRTSPRLAAADLPAFYELEYHGLHMGAPVPSSDLALFKPGQGARIYDYVRPHLSSTQLSAAEIGAGTGTVLREFAKAAKGDGVQVDVVGCEYASAYVDAGRSNGTRIEHGGVESLVKYGPKDLVIMSHVLEHFADIPIALDRVRALCGPKTLVYVEVPGVLEIHKKPEYGYDFRRYLTVAHMYHFCLDTLRDTMTAEGFSFITGDESVRALFSVQRKGQATRCDGNVAARISSYLDELDSSWALRMRRSSLAARRRARRAAGSVVQFVGGERGKVAVRQALSRSGQPWPK